MTSWTTPRDWTDDEVLGASIFNTHVRDNLKYIYEQYPTRAILEHHQSRVQAGNALTVDWSSQDVGAPRAYQDAAAVDDQWTHEFVIAEGTYTLNFRCRTTGDSGIMSVKIDGSVVGTVDLYAGAANTNKTISSVAISGSGKHTLEVTMSSKNGSATDYYARLYKIFVTPESGN
jgi:hypothetical protein